MAEYPRLETDNDMNIMFANIDVLLNSLAVDSMNPEDKIAELKKPLTTSNPVREFTDKQVLKYLSMHPRKGELQDVMTTLVDRIQSENPELVKAA